MNLFDKLEQSKHSWHPSGTFAVVCLMTGKVVTSHSNPAYATSANTSDVVSQNLENVAHTYTPMQVATAVTLMVGIFQVNSISFLNALYTIER